MEEEAPVLAWKPERFDGVVFSDRTSSFAVELESQTGRSMRGVCACDEYRLNFAAASFMGRVVHLSFTVDADGLPEGYVLEGNLELVTNGGEFRIPYRFTVHRHEGSLFGKEGAAFGEKQVRAADALPDPAAFGCVTEKSSAFREEEGSAEERERNYRRFLSENMPADEELMAETCSMLIRENGDGELTFAFFEEAVKRGIQLTHLYESYLATWPEDRDKAMPREILLYFSYEQNLVPLAADRLYRNIVSFEPEGSELYLQYEPRIRDHAAKSLRDGRINRNLSMIYDRMIYPDMIDPRTAQTLPDLIRSHRITVKDERAVTVHVKYPELKRICSETLKNGRACLPVWFSNAVITFHDADGSEVPVAGYQDERLMERPDLLRRCFAVEPAQPMLLFAAAKEILGRGIREEEDKNVLVRVLNELEPEEEFRSLLVRTLVRAGGEATWIDSVSMEQMDPETGGFAFRAFLAAGRRKDAYLYLRSAGMESVDPKDFAALASALLEHDEKPVTKEMETDRFFFCLCKRIFDFGLASALVMDFLTDEYEGSSAEMFAVLREADRNGLPVHDLPERLLTVLLFAEERNHMDEAFVIYLKKEAQKENLLRAFFTFRMTDYFEAEDRNVDPGVFEALTSYLSLSKYHETTPEIYLVSLTKHYADKEVLTARELDLCQRITDLLVSRGLIFAYTKKLRKKIRIPASICERFYIEYAGGANAAPRMIARILPDCEDYTPVNMVRVFHNVYVASTVLFMGDEMHYLVYDDSVGTDPVEEGVITVRKMHGREDDRFTCLNRMTKDLKEGNITELRETMLQYARDAETNRELFRIGEEKKG